MLNDSVKHQFENLIKELSGKLPEQEHLLAKKQVELEQLAATVTQNAKLLEDLKKMVEVHFSIQQDPENLDVWQQAAISFLKVSEEVTVKEIFNAVKEMEDTPECVQHETIAKFVAKLTKAKRVVRVGRGRYRLIGDPSTITFALVGPVTALETAKKLSKKNRARRKRQDWIQVAHKILRRRSETAWTNSTLRAAVGRELQEEVSYGKMQNFLHRTHKTGLIKRVRKGEYVWDGSAPVKRKK